MLKWNRVICVLSRNLRHLEKCFWFPWFCFWPFLDFLFSLVSKTWRNKFPVIGDFLVLWKPDLRLWSIFKPLSTLFFFFFWNWKGFLDKISHRKSFKKLNICNDLFSDGQIYEMLQTSRRPSWTKLSDSSNSMLTLLRPRYMTLAFNPLNPKIKIWILICCPIRFLQK